MNYPSDLAMLPDRARLDAVRRRFLNLAEERLRRVLAELRPNQQEFLLLLPLLVHVNHPQLPGFIGRDVPSGIAGFQPNPAHLELAQRLWRGFQYRVQDIRRFPLHALYLMGSVGSIGHSRASDLDLWLCHQPGLNAAALEALAQKAQRLERWAAERGLEVHFFLMDADAFRRGEGSSLSTESSGSTQHGLLLEEFYRSGLLLAGRPPLWWLIPPEQEAMYAHQVAEWRYKRMFNVDSYLDFGGLAEISANEFCGAGLWQLFKGIHAPYKALLKILLMETYAQGFPQSNWLALGIKQAVYAGDTPPQRMDPYLALYRAVETYLLGRGQYERLELARRCFYFKVGEPLSQLPREPGWRAQWMQSLAQEWGWSANTLHDLDQRRSWKIDRVTRERDLLVRELTRSYRLLTDFAASQGETLRVTPEEINLLGRKLYTTLEQRPGKVEWVNPGISEDLTETELSLYLEANGGWSVHRGRLEFRAGEERPPPVKIAQGLAELLAWCRINGLTTASTHLYLFPTDIAVPVRELERLRQLLAETLPDAAALEPPLDALTQAPYPRTLLVCVNLGAGNVSPPTRDQVQLVSSRSDPLNYGASRRCLLRDLELLAHTSWGELVAQTYPQPEGLLDALCFLLDLRRRAPAQAPEPLLRSEGFLTPESRQVAQRVAQVLSDAQEFFTKTPQGRYVLEMGQRFYLIEQAERGFRWARHDTQAALLEALAAPRVRYSPPGCDPLSLTDSPLPAIFAACRPGEQQAFYFASTDALHLFILDESGSLFYQTLPLENPRFLLLQQQRFLDSLARLRRLGGMTEEAHSLITGPRFYRLERHPDAGWNCLPTPPPSSSGADDYLELRLVAGTLGDQVRVLSLDLEEQSFSALTLGEKIYPAMANLVLHHRRPVIDYPIYLTSVELAQARYGIPPSGVELLTLKHRVEQRLNVALRQLRSGETSSV